jgi:hypothetical protein
MKIKTSFDCKPIPVRSFDWSAIDADTYDGDPRSPIGYGATEQEAIGDLQSQMEEDAPMPHRNQKIFDEGWLAWGEGFRRHENPYRQALSQPQWPDCRDAWDDGWKAAEEDYEHQEAERDDYGDRADFEYDRNR